MITMTMMSPLALALQLFLTLSATAGVAPVPESSGSGGCVGNRRDGGLQVPFALESGFRTIAGCGADVGSSETEFGSPEDGDELVQLQPEIAESLYDVARFASIDVLEDYMEVPEVRDMAIAAAEADMVRAAQRVGTMKSCRSCQALLFSLKRLASLGDEAFVNTLVRTCKNRKVRVESLKMVWTSQLTSCMFPCWCCWSLLCQMGIMCTLVCER